MKKLLLGFIFVILALFISGGAGALTIDDTSDTAYWGGYTTRFGPAPAGGDVIGTTVWSVDSLTATRTGGMTTVVLTGFYFSSTATIVNGSGQYVPVATLDLPGDLYISTTGWRVSTADSPHYPSDTFLQTEGWNYVVSYTDQKVYNLTFASISSPIQTYTGDTDAGRRYQAWRGGYGSVYSSNVTVTLDSANNTLTFIFPDLGPVDSLGYHWTMSCANDVVEGGGTPVPEPATMLLLGSGLIGLAGFARKKFRK
jgi:hypothetical protein